MERKESDEAAAFVRAKAMMWVNDTLEREETCRCSFSSRRKDSRRDVFTVRSDVAVGTESDESMFFAVASATDRRGVEVAPAGTWKTFFAGSGSGGVAGRSEDSDATGADT
jgi:hypothetical protein